MFRGGPFILLLLVLQGLAARATAAEDRGKLGRLEGTVSTGDGATLSHVAGTKVEASGPVTLQVETDSEGRFSFGDLPVGTYTVIASAPGLEDQQAVTVEAGQISAVSFQLRPAVVTQSVSVTASVDSAAQSPAPTQIITEKTVRDAPNYNERMESLLPWFRAWCADPMGGST